MQALYNFVVEPIGERYNNTTKVGDKELILKLLAINIFKKEYNFEITLLFSKNRFITLSTEVIEATLEDQKSVNDKSF